MISPELVTIEKARQILGERGKNLTEKQVEEIINLLRSLSNNIIASTIGKE